VLELAAALGVLSCAAVTGGRRWKAESLSAVTETLGSSSSVPSRIVVLFHIVA
jgi:hypothetical protein